MTNRQKILGATLAVILGGFAAWRLTWPETQYSDDPEVAKLEQLRDESLARQKEMDESERRAEREQFRERMAGLTEEQRRAFWEASAHIFVPMAAKAFEQRYDSFMEMSPEERRKELDRRIDEMEARGDRQPGGPPIDAQRMDEFRKKMLDWTTPEQRAKFENGIRMFNDRRQQRGLAPVKPPGF